MGKFKKIEEAKKALKEKKFKINIEEMKINPNMLGDDIYMQIPSGYTFKADGIKFRVSHNTKGYEITKFSVDE